MLKLPAYPLLLGRQNGPARAGGKAEEIVSAVAVAAHDFAIEKPRRLSRTI
ncbi:MAG: hypothetical protein ACTHJ3_01800 [Pararhizobium sp.]